MNSSTPDWKAQLAGLEMPPPPPAWPPSLAVVLISVLGLVMLLVLALLWRRWRARTAARRAALQQLRTIEDTADAAALSRLLRRVARVHLSPADAARGDSEFAQLLADGPAAIPHDVAETLATCAHRRDVHLEPRHYAAARDWIRATGRGPHG
ncbi:MAG: DUF4381 family protein [Oceanococcaceae bacterium]